MKEIKCSNCGKMLGVLDGEVQIKCPRCLHVDTYRSKLDAKQDSREEEESSATH